MNEPEDRTTEIIQSELIQRKEKRIVSIDKPMVYSKGFNICVISVPEGEEKRQR